MTQMNIEQDIRNLAIIYVGSYIIGYLLSIFMTPNTNGLLSGFNIIKIIIPDPKEEFLWTALKYTIYTIGYFIPRFIK